MNSTRCLCSVAILSLSFCLTSFGADSVVVFNEIMYHPSALQTSGEWVELHNQMAVDVDMSGWRIKGGIEYRFPEGTFLKGGGYLLVGENPAAPELTGALGPFDGQLSNSGESLRLENRGGRTMDEIEYNDKGAWPVAADGSGVTLAKREKNLASAGAENWSWSEQVGGTPGTENFSVIDMRPRRSELITAGGLWRYDVSGTYPGLLWQQTAYDDSAWQEGQAGFYSGSNLYSNEPETIPTLFSTGVNDNGNLLVPGQADPHYSFVANGEPLIAMQNHPAWLANDAESLWVGFGAQGTDAQPAGQFSVATTFDLTGFDPATASITLYLSVDNRIDDVLINGASSGITCANYASWTGPYVINSGFIDGINELEFVFVNEGDSPNPAGMRAKMQGSANAIGGRTELTSTPLTSCFRTSFQYEIPDSTALELNLEALIDDGAVFYLNGTEIYRVNMPAGTPSYADLAVEDMTEPYDTGEIALAADSLTGGLNVLAVELHQAPGGLDDLFFLSGLSVTETPVRLSGEIKVAFNEVAAGTAGSFFLELANYGTETIDLTDMVIEVAGTVNAQYRFAAETLGAGEYRVLTESELGFSPAAGDRTFLFAPQGTSVLDAALIKDALQGRLAQGLTRWYYPVTASPGQDNDISLNNDIVINEIMYHRGETPPRAGEYADSIIVPAGAEASVIVPSDNSLGTSWTGAEPFDDSAWTAGAGSTTGIGYDKETDYQADLGTNIYSEIYGVRQSFYARIPFTLPALNPIETMTLKIKYDDGFAAYLNGQKIAERNAPDYPAFNSAASASHESYGYETIDVSAYAGSLREGENILAIHGLNYGLVSSDLLILPELSIHQEVTAPTDADESDEEWIELYNRGSEPVDLTGWAIEGDVEYYFAPGSIVEAGAYLVIARDSALLSAKYPSIAIAGDFGGRLSNSGAMVTLLDSNGNPADEVLYYDDKPWPVEADGYSASLELVNPDSDNMNAQSWQASDESAKSTWKTYSYRGIAQASSISSPDSQWREFVMGLLDAGQLLLDDISVIEDPDGSAIQLIQNGAFETTPSDDKWRILGTHRHSTVIADPGNAANHVLQLNATGPTEHMHNHIETTFANGRSIVNGNEYEISFRAKWISGSNQLNTRLYFNRLARTTLIDKPQRSGTPGQQNSRYLANPGPVFSGMIHQPAVPKDYESTVVSVRASDPDGISQAALYWRLDGGDWSVEAMSESDGIFEGTIEPQPAASVVQFFILAADMNGAISFYPEAGPDSRALYRVDDGLAATNGLHNLRILTTAEDDAWMHTDINVMSNDRLGATVIYDEDEIFYNVGVRLKSSQHHRTVASDVGFNLAFPADHLFRGVHKTVAIDRSEGNGTGQREVLINQAMNQGNSVISKYSDLVKVMPLRAEHTSAAEMQLARFNDVYLDDQFDNGSEGNLYEYEFVYYPLYTIGGEEDYKLPLPDGVEWNNPIIYLGADKENYRWTYLGKNNRASDSYERLIDFTAAFGDASSAYYNTLPDIIDIEQWLASFAITVASGASDNYGADGSGHNAMLYVRPSDGRVLFLPHDLDLYPASPYQNSIVPNSDLSKIIAVAAYERLYYGHLYHLLTTGWNQEYMSYWADLFGRLLPGQNFTSHLSFIDQRSQYLLSEISNRVAPQYPFEITEPNMVVDTDYAQVSGTGWIDVHEVYLDGIDTPLDLEWTAEGSGSSRIFKWKATVPLEPGVNELLFKAYGFRGELIAQDMVTVTSTMQERPLREFLKVTEIMYNPVGGSDYEFVELTNTGPIPLELTNLVFTEGIEFAFAGSSITELAPDESVVIAGDAAAFSARYPSASFAIAGEFTGKLDNDGETLAILGQWGAAVLSFTYDDARGWPLAADGAGHSLVPQEEVANYSPDYGAAWRASSYINGSPAQADPAKPESVLLNEITAHTDYSDAARPEYDSNDWIELYNPASGSMTLTAGNWFLSDDADNLKKWALPQTVITSGGRVSFDEVSGFHNPITSGFGLDKSGEEVYLSYLPGTTEDRIVDCVRFKGQENGMSLGRYPDGAEFWLALQPSRDAANTTPQNHLIISEIMYHPLDGQYEFVEIYNPTDYSVSLWDQETGSGWRIDGGASYAFSQTDVVLPHGYLLIVPFIPDEATIDQFITGYGNVPSQIIGPFAGNLSNSGERIALEKPEMADVIGDANPWVIIDEVFYSDQSPWPFDADGGGASLWRSEPESAASSPLAWSSALPSAGTAACDFNADGIVNLSDLAVQAENWMKIYDSTELLKGNIITTDGNTLIDIDDLTILLDYWLWSR
ncbi:MAG: lamin tail domain-containing protein [Phycisphaerae bacterium]